jgi:flagellar hook-length control protein FliK
MEEMQLQMQMQQLQSQVNLNNSQATAAKGIAIEQASRVADNESKAAERRTKAIQDLEAANLDKIKAAKELTSIDLSQLQQLIDIVTALKGDEEKAAAKTPAAVKPTTEALQNEKMQSA